VRKPYQESEIFEKMAEHLSIQYEFQKHERPEKKHQLSLEGLAFQDTEWLKALEYAARVGDLDAILDLVGQVQQDYPELGQSLSSLAGEFQFDEILNAVEQHL